MYKKGRVGKGTSPVSLYCKNKYKKTIICTQGRQSSHVSPFYTLVSFYSLCNYEILVCLCKNHRLGGKIFIQSDSFQRGFLFTFNKFHDTLFCFLSTYHCIFFTKTFMSHSKIPSNRF